MLKVNQNIKKENWNSFLLQNNASFLQSFEWGEFQEKLARKIWRLAVEDNGQVLLQVLVIKKTLPFGKSYLYIPFGPCLKQSLPDDQKQQAIQELLGELQKIAKAEGVAYCYIEPVKGVSLFSGLKGVKLPAKKIQPQQTLVIDLTPAEEQIFKSLKSKTTRYNIRFAEKKGVKFLAPKEVRDKEIQIFYDLAQKSAKRDGFINYPKDYFEKLFSVSSDNMKVQLFFSQYENEIIAGNIFIFFGKIAVHLFGGFNHDFRHLMAPYFMHWKQMLFAKKNMACEIYDFWGIDEKKWPGVTHFKRSFGGKELTYPQGYDIVMDKVWYSIFKAARKFLRR
ncbi:MAG: peptidoglycan bridge formation glycyltransferase FemA/FemB family protein [Candidatus Pacebacteria bacterium]|nr:peptidoglycan bridge formation glycyltransferase FemA/FemB family protein [Candidatus Paceibacterota bacterium]